MYLHFCSLVRLCWLKVFIYVCTNIYLCSQNLKLQWPCFPFPLLIFPVHPLSSLVAISSLPSHVFHIPPLVAEWRLNTCTLIWVVVGHYIIYSTLSIFPIFLISADDRNFNFHGATASVMQFRLFPPGGGMVSQQVKAKTRTSLHLHYRRFESSISSSTPVSTHLSPLLSALPHNSPSPLLFHSVAHDLQSLSIPSVPCSHIEPAKYPHRFTHQTRLKFPNPAYLWSPCFVLL